MVDTSDVAKLRLDVVNNKAGNYSIEEHVDDFEELMRIFEECNTKFIQADSNFAKIKSAFNIF